MPPKLLEHTIVEAHDAATGKLDAVRLAETLGFSSEEMAQILKRTSRGLRKNPDSDKLQDDMVKLESLIVRLRYLLDGSIEYVRIWLRSPHPILGGDTPMSCLLERKLDSVELLVHAMETGQPL